jgi:hypothetical protein
MYKFKRSGIFLTTSGAETGSVCETPGVLENNIARCRLDHAYKYVISTREKNDIVTVEGAVEGAVEVVDKIEFPEIDEFIYSEKKVGPSFQFSL